VEAYKLKIRASAAKEIELLGSKSDRHRVIARIKSLIAQLPSAAAEKLAGHDDRFRAREGNLRVVYALDNAKREITIYKIGARRKTYR
jgi:mRNA-degrading endonuclease RelE of RelBE toxin-antitoxin system